MKTEINTAINPETNNPMNTETMNTPANTEDNAVTPTTNTTTTDSSPSESANEPVKDSTAKLAELATNIRAAYTKEHEAGGMVVDWKAKQLAAGIEMGEYLIEAKSLLPFKGFVKWGRENFPDLSQRTLNRYMNVARNKDKPHVSQAKGLRDAYVKCCAAAAQVESQVEGEGESDEEAQAESDLQGDIEKIKRHLTNAKDILNAYQDLASSDESNAICDLVDALNEWATKHRERSNGKRLALLQDSECQISIGDEVQPVSAEQESEISMAE